MKTPRAALLMLAALLCSCAKSSTPQAEPAPEMEFNLLQPAEPATAKLSGLRGQAVILEFWATWCEPCVEELPHLTALAKRFEGRPLRIVSVSDESRDTVEKFLKTHPMPGWVAFDGGAAFRALGVRGRPRTILIDAKGRIAGKTYPSAVYDKIIEDLLAGKSLAARSGFSEPAPMADADALLSLRISLSSGTSTSRTLRMGDRDFQARNIPLAGLLSHVYDVPDDRVIVEAKLGKEGYNLEAKVPREAADSMHKLMAAGVEAAAGLTSRREERSLPVLLMRRASRTAPGLKPSERKDVNATSYGYDGLTVKGATMADLAHYLELAVSKPFFDETGIAGRFDVSLQWEGGKDESLRKALLEQLGLKLETGQRKLRVVVVKEAKRGKAAQ